MKILLGTNNNHKIIEMSRIIEEYHKNKGLNVEIVLMSSLEQILEPVEDGTTFVENAIIKAKYFYDAYKIPVITDDSGIEVDALNGLPGIFSARFASEDDHNATDKANRDKLLILLEKEKIRDAHYTCGIVYYDGRNIVEATGQTYGKILFQETGNNGFGYDCIFYSYALNKPIGLATSAEKDSISHRGIALKNLLDKIYS